MLGDVSGLSFSEIRNKASCLEDSGLLGSRWLLTLPGLPLHRRDHNFRGPYGVPVVSRSTAHEDRTLLW